MAVRKVNQAISASCKAIASLAIRAFTSSSCVCSAFSAGIALTTKIVPPILSTKPVFISSTVITSLRKNRGVRFPLYSFGAILGVFFRYERLCFSGGILYRQPFKSRCLSLPGNKKAPYRYDAFVLLGRWSKGTLFNYLLYFFFLLTTVVPMAAPPLTNSKAIHKARLLVSPVCGDLESSFSFAVTVSAFLISFVPSLSL